MKELRQLRQQLLRSQVADESLGYETVSVVLSLPASAARDWVETHGNPLLDPVSSVILANAASLDGGLILNSSLAQDGLSHLGARLQLAKDATEMLVTTLIVLRQDEGNDGAFH